MPLYYEATAKYIDVLPNGMQKRVRNTFLVNAMSVSETEARLISDVSRQGAELEVISAKQSNISEIVEYGDSDRFFKCKVSYIISDDDSGKEKKTNIYVLVNAEDGKEAYERLQEHLKDMIVPFTIPKVEESPIAEVFGHLAGFRAGLKKVEEDPDQDDSSENGEAQGYNTIAAESSLPT